MDRFERAGIAFSDLCRTMARLRAECPWDRAQTLESLKRFLLEETYEALDAIDGGEPAAHCEELGDLLLQIVFQAEISHGEGMHGAADVARAIDEKLIRRHPHIFATDPPDGASSSSAHGWEATKAKERGGRGSCLDGIPKTMPALMRALRIGEKAAAVGFDWPDLEAVRAKADEEWREIDKELGAAERDRDALTLEIGDLLFALASYARHLDINPEEALNRAVDKFRSRFQRIEAGLARKGQTTAELSLEQLEQLWQQAKGPIKT